MKKIILASASPRRQELLDQMGLDHKIMVSDVDESGFNDLEPSKLVEALASLKAKAVADNLSEEEKDTLIIGADTIVLLEGQILGKPLNEQDAEKMLGMLSGKVHMVYTGVSIVDTMDGSQETFYQTSKIYMKQMSKEEIKEYVLTKEPLDKAGSYGIQGRGGVFVKKIEGDYFTVMGLPIARLYDALKKYK